MRKSILLFLFICIAIAGKAQYAGFSPVADLAKFKADFAAAAVKISTIKSDFIQEKNLAMLSEKIVSKGSFFFKKDNRVRLEYREPYQYLMILNKDRIFLKDGQKENKLSAKSNKLFEQINRIMIDCMKGTALGNTDFKTRIFENKNNSLVELTPVTKGLKELFKTISVTVDKKDFSVISIRMQELSGDNTLIRFTNKDLNGNLPDSLFAIN